MLKISLRLKPFIKKSLDLDLLENFSLNYRVPQEWIEECGNYLLQQGLATQPDIDALKETVVDVISIEFKKEEGLESKIDTGFILEPSTMTASYGPYVVDDCLIDKTFTSEMIVP